ncbi:MAG TPA: hypothetical protein VFG54_01720 [Prolixibacteraceae bacterium]|nr:hypothetical protein [Prolixibacteraceae bacterium]
MSLKSLFLALCLFIAFTSCDQSDDDPTPNVPKIKTITHYAGAKTTSETYEYDSSGRVVKISYTEENYDQYDYRTDTIIMKTFRFRDPDTLLLNHEGRVVSEMFGYTNYEYYPGGKTAKAFIYNWDGELNSSFEYQVTDENTTTLDIWEFVNGAPKHTITYNYEHLANSTNTIGNQNRGMTFYGKQDKNLMSVKKLTTLGTNNIEVVTYRYQLDAKKRVVKKWAEGSPDDVYDAYSYYE